MGSVFIAFGIMAITLSFYLKPDNYNGSIGALALGMLFVLSAVYLYGKDDKALKQHRKKVLLLLSDISQNLRGINEQTTKTK